MNERTKEGNNEWRKNWVLVMLIKIINIFLAGSPWAAWTSGSTGEYFAVFDCREYVRNGGGRGRGEKVTIGRYHSSSTFRVRYDILTVYFLLY